MLLARRSSRRLQASEGGSRFVSHHVSGEPFRLALAILPPSRLWRFGEPRRSSRVGHASGGGKESPYVETGYNGPRPALRTPFGSNARFNEPRRLWRSPCGPQTSTRALSAAEPRTITTLPKAAVSRS